MARSRAKPEHHPLPEQLRRLIKDSGLTHYTLGKAAGVDARVIDRFTAGDRDLMLETAGRLAEALELELVRRRGARGLGAHGHGRGGG